MPHFCFNPGFWAAELCFYRYYLRCFYHIDHMCIICWIHDQRSVVDLLFYVPSIVCGGSVFVFVLICITLCAFEFQGGSSFVDLLCFVLSCVCCVFINLS